MSTNPNRPLRIDGRHLVPGDVERVARYGTVVSLTPSAYRKISTSAAWVRRLSRRKQPTYGVTTGLGAFVNRHVNPSQAAELSRNLVLSHSAGLGAPFDRDIVRGAMLLRLNTLAKGFSGVRPEVTDALLAMLNRGFTPWVPSQGSLGASGDLAPLAHLALAFTAGPGGVSPHAQAQYEGEILPAREALRRAGITPVRLSPKEGLSLTNGPAFSAAMLALDWMDSGRLLASAEVASAMALEALGGAAAAFDPRIHLARGHAGQISVARRMRELTYGSQVLDRNAGLQDAYSLRCIPQILGPVWEAHTFVQGPLTQELNAATDNPLLFGGKAVSGGNFHGAPIALAADLLKTALTAVGALAERQIDRLVSAPAQTGLPPMLVGRPGKAGLQSGLMMLQYTAAALCLENRTLAAPDSVHSLPTSGGQEDLNPNAATAAKNLHQIVTNLRSILAIELMAAAQALDLLPPPADRRLGRGVQRAHRSIRSRIPFLSGDEPLSPHIEALTLMLRTSDWLP